jgi:hypothetical protein
VPHLSQSRNRREENGALGVKGSCAGDGIAPSKLSVVLLTTEIIRSLDLARAMSQKCN